MNNNNEVFLQAARWASIKAVPFPLQPGGSIQIEGAKDISGYDMNSWVIPQFKDRNRGLALNLERSNMIVVDIDLGHADSPNISIGQYVQTIMQTGYSLPLTYTEYTPHGGAHFFYKISQPVKATKKVVESDGLKFEVISNYITVAPSYKVIDNQTIFYRPTSKSKELEDMTEAPQWLVEALKGNSESYSSKGKTSYRPRNQVSHAVQTLNELHQGSEVQQRHIALTQIIGSYIGRGYCFEAILNHIRLDNSMFTDPLPDKEVVRIVDGLCRKKLQEGGIVIG